MMTFDLELFVTWRRGLSARLGRLVPLLLLVMAGGAQAQSTDPIFLIETISVEQAERSTDIIIAESLLVPGREYSERQLRDAVSRISRLPLVLDAEFSLRKGTQRGRYELVIKVEEARRWFFGLDVKSTLWSRPISVSDLTTSDETSTSTGVVGRRFRLGRYGVFFAALGGTDGSINFGYSRHNLLQRGVLFSASYAFAGCSEPRTDATEEGDDACRTEIYGLGLDPTLSSWSSTGASHRVRMSLGIPVRENSSVRLAASVRETGHGLRRRAFEADLSRFERFENREELDFSAAWVFDSVDDPQFPTRGRRWSAGLSLRSLQTDLYTFDLEAPGIERFDFRAAEAGFVFDATRYLPRSDKTSFWAGAQGFLGRSDIDNLPTQERTTIDGNATSWNGGLTFGHSRSLRRLHTPFKWRDWRWENELGLTWTGTSPDFEQSDNPLTGLRIASGIALRNRLGIFRFELAYVDLEGN